MNPSSRRWDREPETEYNTKYFDLRESGYTGPIDENGDAVTTGGDARILRDLAAARGEDTGWWTGEEPELGWDQGPGVRPRAVAAGLVLVVVILVVITGISHLRP